MTTSRIQAASLVLSAICSLTVQSHADDANTPIVKPGWNLIGIPLSPRDPKVDSVFATLIKSKQLLSVWAYDSADGWRRIEFAGRQGPDGPPSDFAKPQAIPKATGVSKKLELIEAGRGYWVEVASDAPGDGIPLEYDTLVGSHNKVTEYAKGWNLVSFDADTKQKLQRAGSKEQPKRSTSVARSSMTAVFGLTGGENIRPSHVVGYDILRKKLVSTKPDSTDGTNSKDSDLGEWLQRGKGYWCYFPQSCVLTPSLVTILDGDIDFDPKRPASFPGEEDFDANRNGKLDGPKDQNTISVGYGSSAVEFLVRNDGQGLLSFQVQPDGYWKATSSVFEPYPKVDGTFDPTRWALLGKGAAPWIVGIEGVHGVSPRSLDDGILADVKDTAVRLTIDRTGLEPGHYLSRFQLLTTVASKTIFLHVTVPPLVGDFEGKGILSHLNGRRNEVGQIDLRLCIKQDPDGMILGFIDSNATGVVPIDVPLAGHKVGSRIFLYGAYTLPARNANGNSPGSITTAPIDLESNRRQSNPFLRRLYRFITIEGIEVSPGQFKGDIHDIFYGDLPFPVHASGLASNDVGVKLSRTVIAEKRSAWFPTPEKAPRGAHTVRGTMVNRGEWAKAGNPPTHITLTGMGRAGLAAVGNDGIWEISGVPPGIYSVAMSSGTSRLVELKEIKTADGVTSVVVPADDRTDDPTQLSFLESARASGSSPSLGQIKSFNEEVPADLGKGKTRLKCDAFVSQGVSFRQGVQPGVRVIPSKIRTFVTKEQP